MKKESAKNEVKKSHKKEYIIGIVGASGAVGLELLNVLDQYDFPIKKLVLLASENSAGKVLDFQGKAHKIKATTKEVFEEENIEICFFSAGGNVSKEFAPIALKAGAVVIDNTSHFRMDKDIALVVPGVNENIIKKGPAIISNPNCSTIQMVLALNPLHKAFNIKRVDVSTYQAVSGAGASAMEELIIQMQKFFSFELDSVEPKKLPHQIALNLIPHIDVFLDNKYTKEEMKMVNETLKVMNANFEVSATCVRVPVMRSHSESISIKFEKEVSRQEALEVLLKAKGIKVIDDIENNQYPMPIFATNTDDTLVGRIREDNFDKKILHLFCVADQLRVGAATNAVKIALEWIKINEK